MSHDNHMQTLTVKICPAVRISCEMRKAPNLQGEKNSTNGMHSLAVDVQESCDSIWVQELTMYMYMYIHVHMY